jgi:hypothetical protein
LTLTADALDNDRVTDVHIAGVGMTRFGRRSESLPDLIAEAAQLALADARIERPDAIVIGAMNPEEFTGDGNFGSLINTHLGLSQSPALRVETGHLVGHRRLLHGVRGDRGRPAPAHPGGGRREDDPCAHAARVGDHRALHRSA